MELLVKIAFITTSFKPEPGGIAELCWHLCRQFGRRGHDVHVVTLIARGGGEPCSDEPFSVARVFTLSRRSTVRSPADWWIVRRWKRGVIRQIVQAVRAFGPDLVLTGTYSTPTTAPVLRQLGLPYCMFLHGGEVHSILSSPVPLRRRILVRTIRRARHVFCNSSFTAALARKISGCTAEQVSAVGCGLPVEQIIESPRRAAARAQLGWDDRPVLLTVARLVYNKGIDTVIQALPDIRRRCPGCRYIVCGEGPCREELGSLVARLGLQGQVELPGYVSEQHKRLLYEAADLFVMTSKPGRLREIEGFGIVFLEANAAGLAVVGARTGGIPDAVEDGVNGLLVEPDCPPALAAAVTSLLEDPARRAAMARAGQERIRQRLNWPAIAADMESFMADGPDRGRAC